MDFTKMYLEFEKKYNPYPVQMSREEAFRRAKLDGLITQEVYEQARTYYGRLWHYVGD